MALRYVTGPNNITGQGWQAAIIQGQPHESTGELTLSLWLGRY